MKKAIMFLLVSLGITLGAAAQTTDVKVKKTSTPAQKVHNTFSKHKRYNGVKAKAKVNGHKVKAEAKKEEVEIKGN